MMEQNNESSAIAEQIMTPYVVMLDIKATFKEVVKKMQKHNISAVIIEDATKSEYFIITKTDIINFLVSGGMLEQNLSEVSVKKLMQGPISLIDVVHQSIRSFDL